MDRQELHLGAFVGFLGFAAKNLSGQFEADTGISLRKASSPLDRLIDSATGYDRAIVTQFIKWAAKEYGEDCLPTDYIDRLMVPNTTGDRR